MWRHLHCWWDCKTVQLLWNIVWNFLLKLKNGFTSNYTLGYLSQGNENVFSPRNLHTNFVAVLFITSPNWKQPRCPSKNEWFNKLWCLHSMEYCLAIKANELFIHITTWVNLKEIMLNEESQCQKVTYSGSAPKGAQAPTKAPQHRPLSATVRTEEVVWPLAAVCRGLVSCCAIRTNGPEAGSVKKTKTKKQNRERRRSSSRTPGPPIGLTDWNNSFF